MGGETRMTPSPLTNSIGILRLVDRYTWCNGEMVKWCNGEVMKWGNDEVMKWGNGGGVSDLLVGLLVDLYDGDRLLHLAQDHVQVLQVEKEG